MAKAVEGAKIQAKGKEKNLAMPLYDFKQASGGVKPSVNSQADAGVSSPDASVRGFKTTSSLGHLWAGFMDWREERKPPVR